MDKREALGLFERARGGIVEAAKAHIETTSGGDPATRFIEFLRSLFLAKKVHVRDRASDAEPEDWKELGWEKLEDKGGDDEFVPMRGAAFVGWADEDHLYLDREAAYAAVSEFAARGGIRDQAAGALGGAQASRHKLYGRGQSRHHGTNP